MNLKFPFLLLIIVSVFQIVILIAGAVFGNLYLILLVIIMFMIELPYLYIHRDDLREILPGTGDKIALNPLLGLKDERAQIINEKAITLTFAIFSSVILFLGISIVTLRNYYPQYLLAGYTLLLSVLFCLVLYLLSRTYYGRKYW